MKLLMAAAAVVGLASTADAGFSVVSKTSSATSRMVMSIQAASTDTEIETVETTTEKKPFTVDWNKLGVTDVTNAYVLLVNERTGNSIALQADTDETKTELPPLALAELESQYLGANQKFRVLAISSTDQGTEEVVASRLVASSSAAVEFPNFNYRDANGSVTLTKTGDRRLVLVQKKAYSYTIALSDEPSHQELLQKLQREEAYYAYVYELPNGNLYQYDEVTKVLGVFDESSGFDADCAIVEFGKFRVKITGFSNVANATREQILKAVEHACGIWSSAVCWKVPAAMCLNFRPYSDFSNRWTLAKTATPSVKDEVSKRLVVSTLYDQMIGKDAFPENYDIYLDFNCVWTDIEVFRDMNQPDRTFYFGIDKNGGDYQHDFVTVLLHEVCHGMRFSDNIAYDPHSWYNGRFGWRQELDSDPNYDFDYPNTFSALLTYNGKRLPDLTPAERAEAVVSDALYFNGPNVMAVNGRPVKMYAPTTYCGGSSVCHWDYNVCLTSWFGVRLFMFAKSPLEGHFYAVHEVSYLEQAAMKDIGWTLPTDEDKKPESVSDVSATWGTKVAKIEVTWTAASGADYYLVARRKGASGAFTTLESKIYTCKYVDADVLSGPANMYEYRVYACNDYGTSESTVTATGWAKAALVTPPAIFGSDKRLLRNSDKYILMGP